MDEPEKGIENSGSWPRLVQAWEARWRAKEPQVFLALTLLIGALVGLTVVGFILLSEHLGRKLYPVEGAAWRRLLVPVGGALLTGWLLYRFAPDARGSGIPQTKAALYARGGRISLRTVIGKFFLTSASLASGIPLGREGPSVHVGAGIASVLGQKLGLSRERIQSLIPVGAAAAIAAAFNTPLAAVLFTLEEIVGDLHGRVLGSVVLSAATSWMVLRLILGNEPLFKVPVYSLVHPVEFLFYAILGVLGALVSTAFTRMLLGMRNHFLRLPERGRAWHPVVGGLAVGLFGWFVPEVLGVGYSHVGEVLNGQMAVRLMFILLGLKLFTVTLSYASGNAGGIFGPSLFLGAMLGGAVGSVAHSFLPEFTGQPGAYALVGMGAVFAGIIRTPMTSVIMIFELTQDYAIIVPLMIANMVSYFLVTRWDHQQIYEALARQEGIHLPTGRSATVETERRVEDVMRPAEVVLSAEMTVSEAVTRTRHAFSFAWPVRSLGGLAGLLSGHKLEKFMQEGKGEKKLQEVMEFTEAVAHVHRDHPLVLALGRMGKSGYDALPVVSRANIRELEGMVLLRDVLQAYGIAEPAPVRNQPEPPASQ